MSEASQPVQNDLAIYVSSFDGYSDIWDNFFYRFKKYWNNCPYPVYLGCNKLEPDYANVTVLHAEEYPDWSNRTLEHLAKIPQDYVLLMLEDYYLNQAVDNAHISSMLNYVRTFDLVYLSLVSYPATNTAISGHPLIGINSLGMQNRTNTQAAIWKKTALIELIKKGESLWEFELNGAARSNRYSGQVCGVWNTALNYDMAVGGGKWFHDIYYKLKKETKALSIDTSLRDVEEYSAMVKRKTSESVSNLIRCFIPLKYRQNLKRFFFADSYK